MLPKKKGSAPKKATLKTKSSKLVHDVSDTINTTKERTFATIEQTFEFHDHKISTRTTHNTSRRDCIDKMEALKLSPFSSPGCSLSPKHRQTFSPIVVKQKQSKKTKKNHPPDGASSSRKTGSQHPKPSKVKQKSKNIQKVKAAFENEFLKRLHDFNKKKITEVSGEMEESIRKSSKPLITAIREAKNKTRKNKSEIIAEMHTKVKEKYRREYPDLKLGQLKILSAIVLIQRLWRQTKVKLMIGEFLSPRNSATCSYGNTFGKVIFKSENEQIISNLVENNEPTMKTDKSFLSISPKSQENVDQLSSIDNDSQALLTPSKSSINLQDLQVSDELSDVSSTKARQNLKYINMYREVTLKEKKEKRKKKIEKPNTFNFPQSLSQKCLLQSLYRKRISNMKCLKKKVETAELFLTSASMEKTKEMYVSPKKPQVVQLEERFYTEAQDEDLAGAFKTEKQHIKLEDQTVGSIGNVGSNIVHLLIAEFSEEFQAFTSKKCLKKKKRLPGIIINDSTIQTYLREFISHIQTHHTGHFEISFTKISGNKFLKFLRILPEEEIFEPGDDADEEELDFPVVPYTAFFEFQPLYEERIFIIKEDDRKYSNFLSGLIKIHNKCLSDSFSEFIEKERLEIIEFPWDKLCPAKAQAKVQEQIKKKMSDRIQEIQKRILEISNTRLGRLHRRDMELEEIQLLQSLKEDYKKEGKDWSEHQELLEVRLELTEMITHELILELAKQMTPFMTPLNST